MCAVARTRTKHEAGSASLRVRVAISRRTVLPSRREALLLLDPLVAVLEVMQIAVNWAREHGHLVVEGGLLYVVVDERP